MQIQTQLPVIVRVDNTAAIYMSQNITTTTWTKHIDVRTKSVKEFCEDGIIKIIFVRSEDNDSDILTKTLQSELFGKHSKVSRYGADRIVRNQCVASARR